MHLAKSLKKSWKNKTKTNCSIFSTISAQLIRSPVWDQTLSLRLSFSLSLWSQRKIIQKVKLPNVGYAENFQLVSNCKLGHSQFSAVVVQFRVPDPTRLNSASSENVQTRRLAENCLMFSFSVELSWVELSWVELSWVGSGRVGRSELGLSRVELSRVWSGALNWA